MPISLVTFRWPETRSPSKLTMTMSADFMAPLLRQVGVTRIRSLLSRTERFPSIAATNPRSCSIFPYRTISSLCLRSVGMGTFRGDSNSGPHRLHSHTNSTTEPETMQNLVKIHARKYAQTPRQLRSDRQTPYQFSQPREQASHQDATFMVRPQKGSKVIIAPACWSQIFITICRKN